MKTYCKLKPEITKRGQCSVLGEGLGATWLYKTPKPLEYRWMDNNVFEVCYNGEFLRAESKDFELIPVE